MVKDMGRLYKYKWVKQSTPTFKKSVLPSSADHASSTINLKGTSILSQLNNKEITTNKNRKKIRYR